MNCVSDTKQWTIYDAKIKQFYYLTHEEFKNILLDKPVKLVGRFINVNSKEKVWIDGLLNSECFK
jgi:hypothetical protein